MSKYADSGSETSTTGETLHSGLSHTGAQTGERLGEQKLKKSGVAS